MNIKLRQQLDKIVSSENEKNWYIPELFKNNTLLRLPKEISVVEFPPEEKKNYNCFLYVLGLYNDLSILKETKGFIFSSFMERLIEVGELKEVPQSVPGVIVLYKNMEYSSKEFTHSGIVQEDGKIISKWSWGPIIIHSLFDVPLSYGNNVQYYQPISKNESLRLYQKYKLFNKDMGV